MQINRLIAICNYLITQMKKIYIIIISLSNSLFTITYKINLFMSKILFEAKKIKDKYFIGTVRYIIQHI